MQSQTKQVTGFLFIFLFGEQLGNKTQKPQYIVFYIYVKYYMLWFLRTSPRVQVPLSAPNLRGFRQKNA